MFKVNINDKKCLFKSYGIFFLISLLMSIITTIYGLYLNEKYDSYNIETIFIVIYYFLLFITPFVAFIRGIYILLKQKIVFEEPMWYIIWSNIFLTAGVAILVFMFHVITTSMYIFIKYGPPTV